MENNYKEKSMKSGCSLTILIVILVLFVLFVLNIINEDFIKNVWDTLQEGVKYFIAIILALIVIFAIVCLFYKAYKRFGLLNTIISGIILIAIIKGVIYFIINGNPFNQERKQKPTEEASIPPTKQDTIPEKVTFIPQETDSLPAIVEKKIDVTIKEHPQIEVHTPYKGKFVVSVASFKDQSKADAHGSKLSEKHITYEVIQAVVNDTTRYRVCVFSSDVESETRKFVNEWKQQNNCTDCAWYFIRK